MSDEPELIEEEEIPRPKQPKIWIPLLVVVVLALIIWASQLSGGDGGIITSPGQYRRELDRAKKLTEGPLMIARGGAPLSAADLKNLGDGIKIFMRLSAYAPDSFGPIFATGQMSFYKAVSENDPNEAVKDYERARQYLNEAVAIYDEKPLPDVKVLDADAHYMLSVTAKNNSLSEEAVRQAGYALEESPGNPEYFWARASASAQLAEDVLSSRKMSDLSLEEQAQVTKLRLAARLDLEQALKVNPNHEKSKSLLRFLPK